MLCRTPSRQSLAVLSLLTLLLTTTGCGLLDGDDGGGEEGPSVPSGVIPCAEAASPLLTTLPMAVEDFHSFVPLGNLNPPGHTFPTDHHYLYLADFEVQVPIYTPGPVWITSVSSSEHVTAGFTDYAITMASCDEVTVTYGHVSSLSDTLWQAIGSFDGSDCDTYSTGGETYTLCRKDVSLELEAGVLLGTAGGNPGQYALDMGVYDYRVEQSFANPSRFGDNSQYLHGVSAIPYYGTTRQDTLHSMAGYGSSIRTIEPVGGTIEQDVPGTAQGIWFLPGEPTYPEDVHLSLVHHNIEADVPVFSVGTSVPGLGSGVYRYTPSGSGTENREFSTITPDGTVYTFSGLVGGADASGAVVLLQMAAEDTLWIERQDGTEGPPWTFSAGKVTFVR